MWIVGERFIMCASYILAFILSFFSVYTSIFSQKNTIRIIIFHSLNKASTTHFLRCVSQLDRMVSATC